MIVQEPPYDLVALFPDLEMQKLFEAWIERGQEPRRRCARALRWRSLRDPRRDTVWRQPERALQAFFQFDCRFLIAWDHHGTGLESSEPVSVEQKVVERLTQYGVTADGVLAVALEPELERLLVPVWPKVKSLLGEERAIDPPDDQAIFRKAKPLGLLLQSRTGFPGNHLLTRSHKDRRQAHSGATADSATCCTGRSPSS